MGAMLNGMALSGLTRPFGGTFLVFSDYMRGAVRPGRIMGAGVTYVWTHDSVGLGEDGPTHQPIEHLWALRAIPGLAMVRPADANETAVAWRTILEHRRPAGLALSRQNLPTIDRDVYGSAEGVARGGYVVADAGAGTPQVLLLATGSEVSLALTARDQLEADGVPTRVVSMPCLEWFEDQDQAYRDAVLPPAVTARVSVEAGIDQGWWKYLGSRGRVCRSSRLRRISDAATELFREFGFTAENVAAAARGVLDRLG